MPVAHAVTQQVSVSSVWADDLCAGDAVLPTSFRPRGGPPHAAYGLATAPGTYLLSDMFNKAERCEEGTQPRGSRRSPEGECWRCTRTTPGPKRSVEHCPGSLSGTLHFPLLRAINFTRVLASCFVPHTEKLCQKCPGGCLCSRKTLIPPALTTVHAAVTE